MSLEDVTLKLCTSLDDVLELRAWLGERRSFLGCDIETEGLNVGRDKIRLIQFGDTTRGYALAWEDWRGAAREILESYREPVAFHNAIFDLKFLTKNGVHVPQSVVHDTMVMGFLENNLQPKGLKPLAKKHVDKRAAAIGQGVLQAAMAGGGWDWATMPIDHEAYWLYSTLDTVLTAMLADKLWPIAQEFRQCYELDMACIYCLKDAEVTGMRIDLDYCERALVKLHDTMSREEEFIPFRPGSDAQAVRWFLTNGYPLIKMTEKGNYACDEEVLSYLRDVNGCDVAGHLLRWRKASKLVSSYFDNFMEMNVDGILRPSVQPLGAKTNRMSITEPALQTVPRGRTVRDAFIPRVGHVLISADYEQMELRVMAHYGQVEAMLDAIRQGVDLHDWTATQLFGSDFTKKQRGVTKNAGFATIYGAGIPKFAVTAGIPVQEAEAFMLMYNELFPGVRTFMESAINAVMSRAGGKRNAYGYVNLVDGMRLYVPADEAYKCVNYIVQGSCARCVKAKIVEMHSAGLGHYIRLPIHDELIFEVPVDDADEVVSAINEVMPDRHSFSVPLDAEAEILSRWGDKYAEEVAFV